VPVVEEKVAQHVAFWPAILVEARREEVVDVSFLEREMVAAPKEASVAKTSFGFPGNKATPKRTAVPAGEVLVSVVDTQPSSTG